ncbi:MAG: hypothetical protein R6V04_01610 [bacterium]
MSIYKKIIILCVLLHVLGSVLYIFKTGDTLKYWDEKDYYTISSNVLEKGHFSRYGIVNNACRPPGYPFFLIAVMAVSDNFIFIKLVQLLLYYLSAYLIYKIACFIRKDQKISLLASGLFLIYPSILYTVNTLYPQILYMCLFLLLIYLLFLYSKNIFTYSVMGIINGFMILVIPLHILFLPIIILLIWRKKYKKNLLKSFIFILLTFMVLLPWTWRNYKIFHEFVFISTNGGKNILFGNCPLTKPNLGTTDISEIVEEEVIEKLNMAEIDRYYRGKAWDFIQQDPLHYLELYFKKFINYFNFRNNLATDSIEAKLKFVLIAVTFYPILFLSILGLFFKEIRKYSINIYFITLFMLSGFFYSVFITRIRFRLPFVPFLIIIAAQIIFFLYDRLKKNYVFFSANK